MATPMERFSNTPLRQLTLDEQYKAAIIIVDIEIDTCGIKEESLPPDERGDKLNDEVHVMLDILGINLYERLPEAP